MPDEFRFRTIGSWQEPVVWDCRDAYGSEQPGTLRVTLWGELPQEHPPGTPFGKGDLRATHIIGELAWNGRREVWRFDRKESSEDLWEQLWFHDGEPAWSGILDIASTKLNPALGGADLHLDDGI